MTFTNFVGRTIQNRSLIQIKAIVLGTKFIGFVTCTFICLFYVRKFFYLRLLRKLIFQIYWKNDIISYIYTNIPTKSLNALKIECEKSERRVWRGSRFPTVYHSVFFVHWNADVISIVALEKRVFSGARLVQRLIDSNNDHHEIVTLVILPWKCDDMKMSFIILINT